MFVVACEPQWTSSDSKSLLYISVGQTFVSALVLPLSLWRLFIVVKVVAIIGSAHLGELCTKLPSATIRA